MREFMKRLKSGTEHLNYGRHIIQQWGAELYRQHHGSGPVRILDLGCGPGTDLQNVRHQIEQEHQGSVTNLELFGIESYAPNVALCKAARIKTTAANIENDAYPGKNGYYDVVLANQVLEHTKEIFWIFSEVGRILKPGGHFIVGVPNIASFHNRLLLMFGQQPTQIQSMSAHVRGFTRPDLRQFAQTGDYFELVAFRGSNFYPLPPLLARPLARLLPNMAWGAFFMFRRTTKIGDFLECLNGQHNFLETPFYGSPQNPARGRNLSHSQAARKKIMQPKNVIRKKSSRKHNRQSHG